MLTMVYLFAFFGAVSLLVAAASWWKIARTPEKEEDVPGHPLLDSQRVRTAALMTAVAFCLSGVAAILAIIDLFVRN
jgi:hypothetical protein